MSVANVMKMVEENDIKFVDFRFTDTRGKEQHVTVPVSHFNEDKFTEGHAFDGSSIGGWKGKMCIRDSNSTTCPDCAGTRLKREARHVKVGNQNIHQVCEVPLKQALTFFESLELQGAKLAIADKIVKEIQNRLKFLTNVGLEYLSLSRSAETLSGGEAQRIRLASQIGSGLTGVMYVLDEPSIGLHQRDNDRLLDTLKRLRDIGNSVIVVEHDQDAIMSADYVVDIGPGAGEHGGQIVAEGTPAQIQQNAQSLTGLYPVSYTHLDVYKRQLIC